jgi:hypothetical protein
VESPLDPQRLIGTVVEVTGTTARVDLPDAVGDTSRTLHGRPMSGGRVGDFVLVAVGRVAVVGMVTGVQLFGLERRELRPKLGEQLPTNPIGTVQFLATLDLASGRIDSGIRTYPNLGCRVYSFSSRVFTELLRRAGGTDEAVTLDVASMGAERTDLPILPEDLLGRHCAILGATGGGKSWTLARLAEACAAYRSKLILLDAAGEHWRLPGALHAHFGNLEDEDRPSIEVSMPYSELDEGDLFAIFRPAGQTQLPKLRLAIRSLKLARLLGEHDIVHQDGWVRKQGQAIATIAAEHNRFATELNRPKAEFDINLLTRQIHAECVWPTDFNDPTRYGGLNEKDYAACVSLLSRIEAAMVSPDLACILNPGETEPLSAVIGRFLSDPDQRVLCVSLARLGFTADVREIVANAIGRQVIDRARNGQFRKAPLVICVDEAHHFLNKQLGDEWATYPLDAFDLIAREGRKYGLTLVLATQRPRDLPETTLSQIGALVIHRMANQRDREAVISAASELDRSASGLIPGLLAGQALVVGGRLPLPVVVDIKPPVSEPDSSGPDFQNSWRARDGA